MSVDSNIKAIYNNYFVLNAVEYKYFNIVITDSEVILDFLNRSFKPWIIRSGIYKMLDYDDVSVEEIKTRNENNLVISFDEIDRVSFNKRTIMKNAFLKIFLKGVDEITLITKDKKCSDIDIDLIKYSC